MHRLLEEREEQGVLAAVAVAEAEADKEDLKLNIAVIGLIISIVTQDISRVLLYKLPLMHFLAICGIDPITKVFCKAFVYMPILA